MKKTQKLVFTFMGIVAAMLLFASNILYPKEKKIKSISHQDQTFKSKQQVILHQKSKQVSLETKRLEERNYKRVNKKMKPITSYMGQIELTVRMPSTKKMVSRLFCSLLRSAVLFWSTRYGAINLILDESAKNDPYFPQQEEKLGDLFSYKIVYEKNPQNIPRFMYATTHVFSNMGYMQQLYSSFLMDLYTNASIIAWVDTDTMFTTVVTDRKIMNDDGRLIVKGMNNFNKSEHHWIDAWDDHTWATIGHPMVADFMIYFPIFIFASTIKNCREYIMLRYQRDSFEDAFVDATIQGPRTSNPCPVCTIMSYAFYFEYNLYDWHIDLGASNLQDYNERFQKPLPKLTAKDITPELHLTIHSQRHYPNFTKQLARATCYIQGLQNHIISSKCKEVIREINKLLFQFSTMPDINHFNTWCKNAQKCHAIVRSHEYDVRNTKPISWTRLSKLDHIARSHYNVSCPILNKTT